VSKPETGILTNLPVVNASGGGSFETWKEEVPKALSSGNLLWMTAPTPVWFHVSKKKSAGSGIACV